jgi:hypothetical protein
MAKLSDLVSDLALRLNVEEKSIATVARYLREAGMLSQGARGVHAAQAKALDAARLIIAMMVEGKAKDAVQRVRDFGSLVLHEWRAEEDETDEIALYDLYGFDEDPTLEQALAAVIAGYGDPLVMEVLDRNSSESFWPIIRLEIADWTVSATLNIRRHIFRFVHPAHLSAIASMSEDDRVATSDRIAAYAALLDRYQRGIRSRREISSMELWPIGEMLAGLRAVGEVDSPDGAVHGARARALEVRR